MKRLFAKKTKNMKEGSAAKDWAIGLQQLEPHLLKCAKLARELKQLLKKYDSAKTIESKTKYSAAIAAIWEQSYESCKHVWDNFEFLIHFDGADSVSSVSRILADKSTDVQPLKGR